ncbi:Glycosyltransferase [hydrothermal vent metagenome]|uniref:Glycosyltransferase n=1 Tax=hydrothermal vent metagenome TaxID=652676 RepID=A0A3B0U042_9ZZZZ
MWTSATSKPKAPRHPPRVLQCFRAPLGGLFRHVADLTEGLVAKGFEVGIICSDEDCGELARARLTQLEHQTALGLHRTAMPRTAGLADISALRAVISLTRQYDIDIIHGHGAKGGAYARAAAALLGARAAYTPHGGSLHYSPGSAAGLVFLTLERVLNRFGGAILFESDFSARTYREKIGEPRARARTVHNGLGGEEFAPLATAPDAADLLYIGEMRELKGVAVLLEALKQLSAERPVSAIFVGSGPERARFEALAGELGLARAVRFEDPMPARAAFAMARMVVVPSLAESFPYVVLEAIAAARPLIATRVGGIPEIFGPLSQRLVAPGDAGALAHAIKTRLATPEETLREAADLRTHVKTHFNADKMVSAIISTYRQLLKSSQPVAMTGAARNPSS